MIPSASRTAKRGPALNGAVGEFGDLQHRVHLERDSLQLAALFQGGDELAQSE